MQEYTLYLQRLVKARNVFVSFQKDMTTDRDKAGAVQAFEFCYELAWKTMKHILEHRGVEVGSPKDAFRKAVQEKLIDDPEIWFNFQKKRNLTVHTYNEENLDIIVSSFGLFLKEMDVFIERIKALS